MRRSDACIYEFVQNGSLWYLSTAKYELNFLTSNVLQYVIPPYPMSSLKI